MAGLNEQDFKKLTDESINIRFLNCNAYELARKGNCEDFLAKLQISPYFI